MRFLPRNGPCFGNTFRRKKGLIKICTINIDEESALAAVYNVLAVPSMMVIQNGEIASASTGAKSKEELLKMLGC